MGLPEMEGRRIAQSGTRANRPVWLPSCLVLGATRRPGTIPLGRVQGLGVRPHHRLAIVLLQDVPQRARNDATPDRARVPCPTPRS